jgi:hypothetical protein
MNGHRTGPVSERFGSGGSGRKDIADLQSPVCHTPVPDIYHRYFAIHVQYLIDHTIIANANPVKIFCTGKFVSIVGNRFVHQILNMIKNVQEDFFGDFP